MANSDKVKTEDKLLQQKDKKLCLMFDKRESNEGRHFISAWLTRGTMCFKLFSNIKQTYVAVFNLKLK